MAKQISKFLLFLGLGVSLSLTHTHTHTHTLPRTPPHRKHPHRASFHSLNPFLPPGWHYRRAAIIFQTCTTVHKSAPTPLTPHPRPPAGALRGRCPPRPSCPPTAVSPPAPGSRVATPGTSAPELDSNLDLHRPP